MNYIDELAVEIAEDSDPDWGPVDLPLYRIYALLALAKGHGTTAKDVHDAWATWRAGTMPEHRSLIPFDQLSSETQHLDDAFVDAIHRAASDAIECERCQSARVRP